MLNVFHLLTCLSITIPFAITITIPLDTIDLKKIVENINSDPKRTWKADTYGNNVLDRTELRKKFGLLFTQNVTNVDPHSSINPFFVGPKKRHHIKFGSSILPKSYDAREAYPFCESIRTIRDQSYCGSCWAVSAASVLSDRICIHSLGYYNIPLSGQYTTSCDKSNDGCNGGYLDRVWKFYQTNGVTTGGEYQSDVGCIPYAIRPCGSYPKRFPCHKTLTPICRGTLCTNEWYKSKYETDIFKVKEYYQLGDEYITIFNEFLIQQEILTNGPVQAGFYVYPDFLAYKSGIYKHEGPFWKDILGGHAVKIIGWGEENGIKYWTVANSWTGDWGEKGTFRIIRGENNCFFESMVYAGIPNI